MKYIVAIDGVGTKTVCVVASECGEIKDIEYGGGSNHQILGVDAAIKTIVSLIKKALEAFNLNISDIACVYMGLAGADLESDFVLLNNGFKKYFQDVNLKIVNDCWIVFSAGSEKNWGAVFICGTGHNAAVKSIEGKKYGIRALRYILGNYGGGNHLSNIAMHYAFRSYEGTGTYTKLEEYLPELCKAANMG